MCTVCFDLWDDPDARLKSVVHMGAACGPHGHIHLDCLLEQLKTQPAGMCGHRLYCCCLDCQVFDNLNMHYLAACIQLSHVPDQHQAVETLPARVGATIDGMAEGRHFLNHYNSAALYLSIEAISAAMLTGFLQQIGNYLIPEEFVLICNERTFRSIVVLAQSHQRAKDGGSRLLAHQGPETCKFSNPELSNKVLSHSVITVRTILKNAEHYFKISLPLMEDLRLAATVADYKPLVLTPVLEVRLTDGVPHTLVNVKLNAYNETLEATLVNHGEQYRLIVEFE